MLTTDVFTPIDVPASTAPQLFIIVDTEEEFDWSAPFSRESVGVTAIQEVGSLQKTVAPYKLKPTYVVDYPVASTSSSVETLGAYANAGECRIGAHLHPWEIDPDQPRLQASRLSRFRHYRNLDQAEPRLKRLLTDFRFGMLKDVIAC